MDSWWAALVFVSLDLRLTNPRLITHFLFSLSPPAHMDHWKIAGGDVREKTCGWKNYAGRRWTRELLFGQHFHPQDHIPSPLPAASLKKSNIRLAVWQRRNENSSWLIHSWWQMLDWMSDRFFSGICHLWIWELLSGCCLSFPFHHPPVDYFPFFMVADDRKDIEKREQSIQKKVESRQWFFFSFSCGFNFH